MLPSFKKAGLCLRAAAAGLVSLVFLVAIHGQSVNGRILGSVHDQQDSAIAGARVTVTDTARNISHATVTDEAGDYVVGATIPVDGGIALST